MYIWALISIINGCYIAGQSGRCTCEGVNKGFAIHSEGEIGREEMTIFHHQPHEPTRASMPCHAMPCHAIPVRGFNARSCTTGACIAWTWTFVGCTRTSHDEDRKPHSSHCSIWCIATHVYAELDASQREQTCLNSSRDKNNCTYRNGERGGVSAVREGRRE